MVVSRVLRVSFDVQKLLPFTSFVFRFKSMACATKLRERMIEARRDYAGVDEPTNVLLLDMCCSHFGKLALHTVTYRVGSLGHSSA